MANLGYQAVFKIFSTEPGVFCERLFLAGAGGGGRTAESGRDPADFDILAFSLSFESDYPNIVRMLDAVGIPARRSERLASPRRWPMLLAGGPATFLNPEPVAPFFDVFLIGEGEEMLRDALAGAEDWDDRDCAALGRRFASIPGCYRPASYEPVHAEDGELIDVRVSDGAPPPIKRRYITDLDAHPATTSVIAPGSVFGGYYLVEASRGCEWGCRFCAAGFMYRPVRHRSSAGVVRDALAGLEHAQTVGLVGAEMAGHPGIAESCEQVVAGGGRVSPSSLKADLISPRLARALASGGTRSVTIAPEAGSERMRRVINKNLSENEILRATELMVGDGVESLKLYFMCGLPTESDEDLRGIYELTLKIRELMMGHGRKRGRVGRIKVGVNLFVPKPWTPFQWDPMLPVREGQRRMAWLRQAFGRLPNVDIESESPREAYMQTLFSRGDRTTADIIEALAREPGGWWQQIQDMRRGRHQSVAANPDRFVHREYRGDERFPWDFIDHHIERSYLWLERRRALAERETEPCDVATCKTCGAC